MLDDVVPFDLAGLRQFLAARLPVYAMPVFLRLSSHLDVTGTFKQRKLGLVAEGFDPASVTDPLFVAPAGETRYRTLDASVFATIASGTQRL